VLDAKDLEALDDLASDFSVNFLSIPFVVHGVVECTAHHDFEFEEHLVIEDVHALHGHVGQTKFLQVACVEGPHHVVQGVRVQRKAFPQFSVPLK